MKTMKTLYNYLEKQGFKTDYVVANKEGEYVSISEDGYSYILKRWFDGEECNAYNEEQVCRAAEELAKFHKVCESTGELWEGGRGFHPGKNMLQAFARHNNEIVRIRNYIKKRKNKNYFEMSLQKIIEPYYRQGVLALSMIGESDYEKKYAAAVSSRSLNHGSFNHHNIMFENESIIMVNMMKINYAPQIQDLYDFLRKIMEKNSWSIALGNKMLDAYDGQRNISTSEYRILKAMFCYPEKFWKIINYYYNSNKAWYSEKNEDKLKQFQKQEDLRWKFIENM